MDTWKTTYQNIHSKGKRVGVERGATCYQLFIEDMATEKRDYIAASELSSRGLKMIYGFMEREVGKLTSDKPKCVTSR